MVSPTDPTADAIHLQTMASPNAPAEVRTGRFGGMNFIPDFPRVWPRIPSIQKILSRLGLSRAELPYLNRDHLGDPSRETQTQVGQQCSRTAFSQRLKSSHFH